jgi:predicted  nucleic acid-binding Zn-ribbon protein
MSRRTTRKAADTDPYIRTRKLSPAEQATLDASIAHNRLAAQVSRNSVHLHSLVVQKRVDLAEFKLAQETEAIENLESAMKKAKARAAAIRAERDGYVAVLASRSSI